MLVFSFIEEVTIEITTWGFILWQ